MSPRWLKRLIPWWPPYWGTGIRVTELSPDWRRLRVEMPLRWYNRNVAGTHFGGSLFAMTDPFYMLMLMHVLGPSYYVWDRAGSIDFLSPGRERVGAEFVLGDEDLATIRARTAGGEKHLHPFTVEIRGMRSGALVARVERIVYVRLRPPFRPGGGR